MSSESASRARRPTTQPTRGEVRLAARLNLPAADLARARVILNTIAALPWPRPERVALLRRLARNANADVGTILGGMALDIAPLSGFDALIPIDGLAEKRVAGLAVALAPVEASSFAPEAHRLVSAFSRLSGLEAENLALREELDRVYSELVKLKDRQGAPLTSEAMTLGSVASSVGEQLGSGQDALDKTGLSLADFEVTVAGGATAIDDAVGLVLGSPASDSALTLRFSTAGSASPSAEPQTVPDLRAYTPALARRKLQSLGLEAQIISVHTDGAQRTGRIVRQSPEAGSQISVGSVLRLFVR